MTAMAKQMKVVNHQQFVVIKFALVTWMEKIALLVHKIADVPVRIAPRHAAEMEFVVTKMPTIVQ